MEIAIPAPPGIGDRIGRGAGVIVAHRRLYSKAIVQAKFGLVQAVHERRCRDAKTMDYEQKATKVVVSTIPLLPSTWEMTASATEQLYGHI